MISATLFRKDGRYTGYQARGHSGYAEEGSDIVCAAVSILGCTCVNSLESLLDVRARILENQEGRLAFELPPLKEEQKDGAELLMGALAQGLSDLRDGYPGYVKFEIKERRESR